MKAGAEAEQKDYKTVQGNGADDDTAPKRASCELVALEDLTRQLLQTMKTSTTPVILTMSRLRDLRARSILATDTSLVLRRVDGMDLARTFMPLFEAYSSATHDCKASVQMSRYIKLARRSCARR